MLPQHQVGRIGGKLLRPVIIGHWLNICAHLRQRG